MKKFALLLVAVAVVSIRCFSQVEGGPDVSAPSSTTNLKLDHFWCYIVSSASDTTTLLPVAATLTDQFFTTGVSATVGTPLQFCNPVQKTVGGVTTGIVNILDHLTMYHLKESAALPTSQTLTATNQFGATQFTVDKATILMVPTNKNNAGFPPSLDHFLCYPVKAASIKMTASLADQFQGADVIVEAPTLFCNPVAKTIGTNPPTDITNPDAHLLCYNIRLPKSTDVRQIRIQNQLETGIFAVSSTPELCVPSTKTLP